MGGMKMVSPPCERPLKTPMSFIDIGFHLMTDVETEVDCLDVGGQDVEEVVVSLIDEILSLRMRRGSNCWLLFLKRLKGFLTE